VSQNLKEFSNPHGPKAAIERQIKKGLNTPGKFLNLKKGFSKLNPLFLNSWGTNNPGLENPTKERITLKVKMFPFMRKNGLNSK